ncbi:MAG: family 10 glycosylhydrolase, partial [Gemmatimonadetes bacterium]|nr:family 10 glycosylhydrolase [Gemmatimonadota bacterium]
HVYARSPDYVARELDWMKSVGINTYFPLAFASGRVNWPSERLPDTRALYGTATPVDAAVRGGDERGIATHLYFILGFVGFLEDAWSAPELRQHPEWDVVGATGKGTLTGAGGTASSWGTLLWWDLGHPEVQERVLAAIAEALDRYPTAEGIHLDYIRSAHSGGCFSPTCLARFEAATGVRLPDSLADAAARAGYIRAHLADRYTAWRAGEITELVRRIRRLVDEKRPGAVLSAAVFAGADGAYRNVFQDWRRWAAEGLVDAVYPMFYGDARARIGISAYLTELFGDLDRRAAALRRRRAAVVLGLQTAPYDAMAPDVAAQAIESALASGADGVALQMLPYWWHEQYAEFRRSYAPRSDPWPPLWNYDAVLRQIFLSAPPPGTPQAQPSARPASR